MTPAELHTLHDEALQNLDEAMREEDASGKAIDSMSRTYWEGYSEALAEVIRITEGRA